MIGLIMEGARAIGESVAGMMGNIPVTNEYKVYSPDISSIKNAGLYNVAVDLGETSRFDMEQTNSFGAGLVGATALGAGVASQFIGKGNKEEYDLRGLSEVKSLDYEGSIANPLDTKIQQRQRPGMVKYKQPTYKGI